MQLRSLCFRLCLSLSSSYIIYAAHSAAYSSFLVWPMIPCELMQLINNDPIIQLTMREVFDLFLFDSVVQV